MASAAAMMNGEGGEAAAGATDTGGAGGAAPAGTEGGAGDPWYAALPATVPDGSPPESLSDRAFVENKKWGTVADAVASYRQLETLVGHKGVPIPKDDADTAGWNALYAAAGRPAAATDYKLGLPADTPPEFGASFAAAAHPLGVSQKQAAGLAKWYAEQEANAKTAEDAAFATRAAQDTTTLKTEWGDNFKANAEIAGRAAKQFGFDDEKVEKLERVLGTAGVMKFLNDLGKKVGEDQHLGGGSKGLAGGMSLENAKTAKAEFMASSDLQAKLRAKDPETVAKWASINEAMGSALDAAEGQ